MPHQIVDGHRSVWKSKADMTTFLVNANFSSPSSSFMTLKTFVAERLSMDPPFSKYVLMSFAKILAKSCAVYSVSFFSMSFLLLSVEAEAGYPGSKTLTGDKAKLPSVADCGPSYLVYKKHQLNVSFVLNN